jgi:hypothetical protein
MDTVTFKERDVQVTSVYFRKNPNQLRFESFPKRLVYKGREYILADV